MEEIKMPGPEGIIKVLVGLQRAPNCWCEAGIGNPMVPNHTDSCKAARSLVKELDECQRKFFDAVKRGYVLR